VSQACRHVTIRGRVQGVGYRAWVEHTAMTLRLEGWVRNRRDGSVEAVFAGPGDTVAQMIERCRQGPASARVDSVHASEAGAEMLKLGRDGGFSMLPTL
jgi:acylphosphatase